MNRLADSVRWSGAIKTIARLCRLAENRQKDSRNPKRFARIVAATNLSKPCSSCHRHCRLGSCRYGCGQLGECCIENLEHEIGVGLRNGHGRREANDAAMKAAFTEQQTHFTAKLENLSAFGFARLLRRAILNKLDPEHQPFATNIADQFVFGFQFFQTGQNIVPEPKGIFLELVALDNFENGFSHSADNRVAAKSVEVNSFGEDAGNLRRGYHCSERASVSDTFGHGYDVRDHALRFKSPEVSACAAKAGLHFVGNTDAAGGTHMLVDVFEIAIGKNHHTPDPLNGFGNKTGDLAW